MTMPHTQHAGADAPPAAPDPDPRTPVPPDTPGAPRPGAQLPGRGPGARALVWIGGIAAAAAIVQVGYQAADHLFATTSVTEHSYASTPVVSLVADGDVTVTVGGSDSVNVAARSRSGFTQTRFSADEQADQLTVENSCVARWMSSACSADLSVQVPEGTKVVVKTSSGRVSATGVDAGLDLSSGDGDVSISGADGPVSARTSSGHIEVDAVSGAVVAITGDGDVRVRDAGAEVQAKTSSGHVTVTDAVGAVQVSSGDGDVTVRQASGAVQAKTNSGHVVVVDAGDDVQSTTGDGDVTVEGADGDVLARSSSGHVEVSGALGDVDATAGDGDVTVWGTGTPVALDIRTGDGKTTIEGPTDPKATRTVVIRSSSGHVKYLDAR